MRRRPIAAVVPSGASWERVEAVLHGLESVRIFEVSVVKTQGWLEPRRPGFRKWGHRRRLAFGLSSHWLRRPRAQRPELLIGFGAATPGAVGAARVLGIPALTWVGFDAGGIASAEDFRGAQAVWTSDIYTQKQVSQLGLRAQFLSAGPREVSKASSDPPRSLGVLLPRSGLVADPERQAIHRFSEAGMEVVAIGERDLGVGHRFVSRADPKDRLSALESSKIVLALQPAAQPAEMLEALMLACPLVVPETDLPRFFAPWLGRSFRPGRSERLFDALIESWAEWERGSFELEALAKLGRSAAMPAMASTTASKIVASLRGLRP